MTDDRRAPPLARLVLASNNPGKLREFSALFSTVGIEVLPQGELAVPEADEPFVTFVVNALAKARHASRLTGLPAIADDSGLCVRAQRAGLDKSDAANNAHLVDTLRGVDDRRAYYCCVLALVRHADDPEPLIAEGRWHGEIVDTPRGAHGFGYDPHFFVPALGATAAELEPAVKNALSHRALALKALLERIPEEI